MPILLFAQGRKLLTKDSKKLFYGLKIGKKHLYVSAGVFLAISAESGWYARQNLPGYSHFGNAEVLLMNGTGLGNRKVRVVLTAEAQRRELQLKVGHSADFGRLRDALSGEELQVVSIPVRHAEPQLRLLVFGPQRGWKGWLRHAEELVGYCQIPLDLLGNGEHYEGNLRLHHPISHQEVGELMVRICYQYDEAKTRLSYVAPEAHSLPNVAGKEDPDEHISHSIDLMQLLSTAQSVSEQIGEIREQLADWWGWERPFRSLFTATVLTVIAVRPQFTGIWFHTVFSTAMVWSGVKHLQPEFYAGIRPLISAVGFDANRVDCALDSWMPQIASSASAASVTESDAALSEGIADRTEQGKTIELSSKRWLILRTAEYAGWLKPLGPVLLSLDSLLAEMRRVALWEDVPKAGIVTAASMVLGLTSSFIRVTKQRPATWVAGLTSLSVLATAPWMASGGTLKGSWAYFGHAFLSLGSFPKIQHLDAVNAIQPWDPKFHSAKAWKDVLLP